MQDSIPERRNLMITSMVFIIYFWGGGRFENNEIRLPFISVHFENIYVLAILSWITLVFFALRFLQSEGIREKNAVHFAGTTKEKYNYIRDTIDWLKKGRGHGLIIKGVDEGKDLELKLLPYGYLNNIFIDSNFFSYVFPYCLFFIAILSGFIKLFTSYHVCIILFSVLFCMILLFISIVKADKIEVYLEYKGIIK
ncbi:MAG: hypothetical protein R3D71_06125 [Rickettsiales bacterium]